MLWIRIGFTAESDPDPPFYINADSDPDPDPVPGQTVKSQEVHWFLLNIIN